MDKRNKKTTTLRFELKGFINANQNQTSGFNLQLQQIWQDIATTTQLNHTDNIVKAPKDKYNVILIYTDSSQWAAELSTQKELYRILFEQRLKCSIREVKFLVTRKTALKKIFQKKQYKNTQKKSSEKSIKLNEKEEQFLQEKLTKITDPQLKQKLYNSIKADFEWKKGQGTLKLP